MSDPETPESEQAQGPIAAPSLDGAVGWLNVAAPITLAQLRGKVVILDFWTYGCINCMHILRDLKTLETRFPDELVVIGVHSPKFTNEKDNDNLKRILVRYEIEHPVANDADHQIWRRYGVQAWPTRVIIDPAGNIVGTAMGEGNLEGFISAVRTVVRVFEEQRAIDRAPLALDLERRRHADRPLLYPGKVLADEASGRLFISDSNHNRIVVASLDGRLIETIGSGLQGDNDGIFLQARFYRPQGLALDPSTPRVASRLSVAQGRTCTSPTPKTTRSASSISRRARSTPLPARASKARGAVTAATRCRSISTRRGISRSSPASSSSPWRARTRFGSSICCTARPIPMPAPARKPGPTGP